MITGHVEHKPCTRHCIKYSDGSPNQAMILQTNMEGINTVPQGIGSPELWRGVGKMSLQRTPAQNTGSQCLFNWTVNVHIYVPEIAYLCTFQLAFHAWTPSLVTIPLTDTDFWKLLLHCLLREKYLVFFFQSMKGDYTLRGHLPNLPSFSW